MPELWQSAPVMHDRLRAGEPWMLHCAAAAAGRQQRAAISLHGRLRYKAHSAHPAILAAGTAMWHYQLVRTPGYRRHLWLDSPAQGERWLHWSSDQTQPCS